MHPVVCSQLDFSTLNTLEKMYQGGIGMAQNTRYSLLLYCTTPYLQTADFFQTLDLKSQSRPIPDL